MMGKKYTYEDVKAFIEKEGYVLLSTVYENTHSKLKLQCPEGHEWFVSFNTFKKGHRCSVCAGNKTLTYKDVKNFIEKEGYTLLSDTYKNNHESLSIRCSNGHEYKTTFNTFKKCSQCKADDVKKHIEKSGYTMLSAYNGSNTKLKLQCPEGHEWDTYFNTFKKGHRCSVCAGNKTKTTSDIRNFIEKEGYTLLSDTYKNIYTKLNIQCSEGHTFEMVWNNFQQGHRCPLCSIISSKPESDIAEFLKQYVDNITTNDRTIISPLELDIYLPDHKIAIEYNGLYWHSEQQGKDKNYHLNKTLMCQRKGIQLIHVFSDEWINKSDVVKSVILSKLGIFKERLYARKCYVKKIDSKTKSTFLNSYHLQGSDNASYNIGLFYNDDLVSVMTFGRRSISSAKGSNFELLRFCNKPWYQIVGGASKMLKWFLKENSPPCIKTFADLRYSDGSFYKKIGFELKHTSKPNYWYIVDGIRKHRVGYQKHKLKDKLVNFDPNKTEYENVLNSGIDRIWDCGNYVFEYRC